MLTVSKQETPQLFLNAVDPRRRALCEWPLYGTTLHSTTCWQTRRGGWECCATELDGNVNLVVKKASVWFERILFKSEGGTKGRHTPKLYNDDLQQRGQTPWATEQWGLSSNMLHVTLQPESWQHGRKYFTGGNVATKPPPPPPKKKPSRVNSNLNTQQGTRTIILSSLSILCLALFLQAPSSLRWVTGSCVHGGTACPD